jgi:hypothetical protein
VLAARPAEYRQRERPGAFFNLPRDAVRVSEGLWIRYLSERAVGAVAGCCLHSFRDARAAEPVLSMSLTLERST